MTQGPLQVVDLKPRSSPIGQRKIETLQSGPILQLSQRKTSAMNNSLKDYMAIKFAGKKNLHIQFVGRWLFHRYKSLGFHKNLANYGFTACYEIAVMNL